MVVGAIVDPIVHGNGSYPGMQKRSFQSIDKITSSTIGCHRIYVSMESGKESQQWTKQASKAWLPHCDACPWAMRRSLLPIRCPRITFQALSGVVTVLRKVGHRWGRPRDRVSM